MAKSGIVDGEIREGYLCPICLCDLKSEEQLQDHFDFAHSSEDHDVFQALKGFIGKAKRKILKQDSWAEDFTKSSVETNNVHYSHSESTQWPMQDIGLTTSHSQEFQKFRDIKIYRYNIETNTLLIRLNKYVSKFPDEPEKRKEFEQSIIPWIPDSDVKLCPGCAKSFGLSRRRHHCRLCGGVMCQACSFFLTFDFARKLTANVARDDQMLLVKSSPVIRRPSSASLMSVVSMGGEQQIRICRDCDVLLQRRHRLENIDQAPIIGQMYERLKLFKDEIETLVSTYIEMLDSLNSGETEHQLQEARELHLKISHLAEKVDAQSKRILKLEANGNSRTVQLQSGIRMAATQFLRNDVLGLLSPPTEEEIAQYQRSRLELVQRRIQDEKLKELSSERRKKQTSKSPSPAATPKRLVPDPISPDQGWCGIVDRLQEEADPMLQQITIINKYIQQARMDHKYDEVTMLEQNLSELKLEYRKQKESS